MVGRARFLGLFILMCGLLLGGCSTLGIGKRGDVAKEIKATPIDERKAELLRRIDRKFEDAEAHFELGQLYQKQGLWSEAENQYNITLSFNPVHRPAQAARVKVLMEMGDKEQAGVSADFYVNQASNSALGSLKLAMAFQEQELDDYALRCYEQALRLAPTSAKINRQIGYYYLSKGDRVRAQDYLTRSFQLNPNQPEVAGELGRLGVEVKIPRKTERNPKRLDKIVEESDKKARR